jgi:hypothetical protein
MEQLGGSIAMTHPIDFRRWTQFLLRSFFVGIALLTVLLSYGGSYYRLSRRGLAQAETYGLEGFLYVPADDVFLTQDLRRHYSLAHFYTPANWIDQNVCGGKAPVACILFSLEKHDEASDAN